MACKFFYTPGKLEYWRRAYRRRRTELMNHQAAQSQTALDVSVCPVLKFRDIPSELMLSRE